MTRNPPAVRRARSSPHIRSVDPFCTASLPMRCAAEGGTTFRIGNPAEDKGEDKANTKPSQQVSFAASATIIPHVESSPHGESRGHCATNRRDFDPAKYAPEFCEWISSNPTIFHTVVSLGKQLDGAGFVKLSERDAWDLEVGGKYYVERNGSSLIAFVVGHNYKPGNGAAMVAGHIDALCAKLKPISKVPTTAGFVQLGVAPYAGALNSTWWDRDLGIGGRVLVKGGGKIVTRLVQLPHPIARIPTLAPHFGAASNQHNPETNMVPIIGLDNSDVGGADKQGVGTTAFLNGANNFAATQPSRLVEAIARELGIEDYDAIVNWELELFDTQPAALGGLDKEFLFAGRLDDKLCSWAAIQALLNTTKAQTCFNPASLSASSTLKIVALFDDEEIGSLLRQGARGNFLPSVISRIVDGVQTGASSTSTHRSVDALTAQTLANSFLVSSDVSHAVNPNYLGAYLANHEPRLNVGVAVHSDSNGHMTSDSVSTAFLQRCAERTGSVLQIFQIRNDSRSGGTVGPMLSSRLGCRAVDAGIPQLSMHSIRATTGSLDPGLGVKLYQGFLEEFEAVDEEFRG